MFMINKDNKVKFGREGLLSAQQHKLVLFIMALNLIPMAQQWILVIWLLAFVCFSMHWLLIKNGITPLKKLWRNLLIALGVVILLANAKALGVLLGMFHLLAIAYLLKSFELYRARDVYQFFFIGFLLIFASFVYHQSIYFALAVFVLVVLNVAVIASFHRLKNFDKHMVRTAVNMAVLALPLACFLFLFFPKISPFWQVPNANSKTVGLSDSLELGEMASLALSNELAFRVEFIEGEPEYQKLYWRAMVLESYEDNRWERRFKTTEQIRFFNYVQPARLLEQKNKIFDGEAKDTIKYQVILEPSYKPWLFVLDRAVQVNSELSMKIWALKDYSFSSDKPISKPVSYTVDSVVSAPINGFDIYRSIQANMVIDDDSNPGLRAYAKKWRDQGLSDLELVNQVLSDFHQQPFRYTLDPPPLSGEIMDEFFFGTKAGFCEHYASTFTFIMRAAGIPARVVTGYLGGELNQQGNYYQVYQRDAHAWSEVWFEGRGWVRVDPTAAVDPSRVEQGFSAQLSQERNALRPFSVRDFMSSSFVNQLAYYVDALDYQWTKYVINYSKKSQQSMLKEWFGRYIGISTLFIVFGLIGSAFMIIWWLNYRKQEKPAKHILYYQKAISIIANLGVIKKNHQTDQQYIANIQNVSKGHAVAMAKVLSLFNAISYGKQTEQEKIYELNAAVKALSKL